MFPQEWSESGVLINKGPSEAIARQIWTGERFVFIYPALCIVRKLVVCTR